MIKYMLLGVVALIVTIIVAIPVYLGPDDLSSCSRPEPIGSCQQADAIIAVSGGDTRSRTAEAVGLYKKGWAPLLIFSGAAADPSGPSNAEAMKSYALEEGVPESRIIIEEFSRTTAENALNTSQFIVDRGISQVIVVTSAYHQRRASLEFSSTLGPSVTVISHPVPNDAQWHGFWWWTTPGGWWLAVGELLKILAFYSAQGAQKL